MSCGSSLSLGKKWIFFHFLFVSIFFEYQETLGDYKSVGCWVGREEALFSAEVFI